MAGTALRRASRRRCGPVLSLCFLPPHTPAPVRFPSTSGWRCNDVVCGVTDGSGNSAARGCLPQFRPCWWRRNPATPAPDACARYRPSRWSVQFPGRRARAAGVSRAAGTSRGAYTYGGDGARCRPYAWARHGPQQPSPSISASCGCYCASGCAGRGAVSASRPARSTCQAPHGGCGP